MALPSGTRRFRLGGSAFTVFRWKNAVIASARQVTHTSPAPVGPGPVPIQPLDARRPLEIITPAAVSMGQLTLEMYELYGRRVWDELSGIAGSKDLADIFLAVADTNSDIQLSKFILPPKGASVGGYSETYHNCVITNVQDGETIEVGTMEILKPVTVGYTHVSRTNNAR